MAVVEEILRSEADGSISFANKFARHHRGHLQNPN